VFLEPVERLASIGSIDQRVLAEHHLIHLVHELRVVDDEHFPWLQGSLPDPVDRGSPGGSLATNPKALKPGQSSGLQGWTGNQERRELVEQLRASWNSLLSWLREVQALGLAAEEGG
jgi:hypothetical protein